jgi:hypothetical protein
MRRNTNTGSRETAKRACRAARLTLLTLVGCVLGPVQAYAAAYGDLIAGPNVVYRDVADVQGLLGPPTVSIDQLVLDPVVPGANCTRIPCELGRVGDFMEYEVETSNGVGLGEFEITLSGHANVFVGTSASVCQVTATSFVSISILEVDGSPAIFRDVVRRGVQLGPASGPSRAEYEIFARGSDGSPRVIDEAWSGSLSFDFQNFLAGRGIGEHVTSVEIAVDFALTSVAQDGGTAFIELDDYNVAHSFVPEPSGIAQAAGALATVLLVVWYRGRSAGRHPATDT